MVNTQRFNSVDKKANSIPTLIEGIVSRPKARGSTRAPALLPADVVVAINGTTQGQTTTYDVSEERASFAVMVSPAALVDGHNSIEIYGLIDGSKLAPIVGVNYRLGGNKIIRSDGWEYSLDSGPLRGFLEGVRHDEGKLILRGYAADGVKKAPAERILVFLDGQCVFSGQCNLQRRELEKHLHPNSGDVGFRYILGLSVPPKEFKKRVRLFAVSGTNAYELMSN